MNSHRLMVIGRVHRSGIPRAGAIVHLTSFTAAGTAMNLRQGVGTRVNTNTDDDGYFSIYVGVADISSGRRGVHGGTSSMWEHADMLRAHLHVVESTGDDQFAGFGTNVEVVVVRVVSLRNISRGTVPELSDPTSFARDVGENYLRLRGYLSRIPYVGLTVVPPSPEWLELLGFQDIDLDSHR
ncbi:MAG: hypothetical protein R3C19_13805 [Planctomycetaceae bacterium]